MRQRLRQEYPGGECPLAKPVSREGVMTLSGPRPPPLPRRFPPNFVRPGRSNTRPIRLLVAVRPGEQVLLWAAEGGQHGSPLREEGGEVSLPLHGEYSTGGAESLPSPHSVSSVRALFPFKASMEITNV